MESLALAVPTITTNIGGFPDVVIEGETGRRVPAKDPAALAEAIAVALDDPRASAEMARKGQKLVRGMFNARNTSAQIASIYVAIIEGRSLPC